MPSVADWSLEPSIDPVRSSTTMMSSGLAPHGEHAWECTVIGMVSMPITRRNAVGTLVLSVTWTVLAGLQNFG